MEVVGAAAGKDAFLEVEMGKEKWALDACAGMLTRDGGGGGSVARTIQRVIADEQYWLIVWDVFQTNKAK